MNRPVSALFTGPVIITRYKGPTDHRPSRIIASHQRDSERTWRKVVEWNHELNSPENHRAAADALLNSWPLDSDLVIVGQGFDHGCYYWLVVGRWQLGQS